MVIGLPTDLLSRLVSASNGNADSMRNRVQTEIREFLWLLSMVIGISAVGVALAVGLALALVSAG